MASYVVMERRAGSGRLADTVFVRDEFSFVAFFFPFFWLLWHRLWFAALMIFLASIALALIGEWNASTAFGVTLASLVIGILVAVEGPQWRIGHCRRAGYGDAGTIDAANLEEAEIRWFARAAPPARAAPAAPAFTGRPHQSGVDSSDMLFGFAGDGGR
jgi:hypothetical protein